MKIKELYKEERPREKALKIGIENLSNRELLALLIRCGTRNKSALDIADEILAYIKHIHNLYSFDLNELIQIKGVSKIKILELSCIREISKRISYSRIESSKIINNALVLGEWLNHLIGYLNQEHFMVVFLNIRNQIIHYKSIFIGSLNSAVVHPREIFKEAMKYSAYSIILAHNHPSGDIDYSLADKEVTVKLIEAGKICGIPVLDHVIVGKNKVFSFREHNILKFE